MLKELGRAGPLDEPSKALSPGELDAAAIETFLAARRAAGQRRVPSLRAMHPLVSFLREAGVMAPEDGPEQLTPLERFVAEYRDWLVGERGLAEPTVIRYERLARRFMAGRVSDAGELDVAGLTGADVSAFLLEECARVSVGSAKGRVAELRSLLRFLVPARVHGASRWPTRCRRSPAGATPRSRPRCRPPMSSGCWARVTGRRSAARATTRSCCCWRGWGCARSRSRGCELEDLDWRAGELVVRGKARRQDRLPLPADVGEALAGYLSLRGKRGLAARVLDGEGADAPDPRRAGRRRRPARLPARRASRMSARTGCGTRSPASCCAQGASMVDISQLLRHSDLATTAGYAKVDLGRLRQVARPWPGATR